jgi:RNA polymerase sigma-70 factor (ECF subfamily)
MSKGWLDDSAGIVPAGWRMTPDSDRTRGLLELAGQGDRQALQDLLAHYQPEVYAYVEARLDPRVRRRVAPSDVVQETQLEVVRRLPDYLRRRPMPFHLWVRRTAYERLMKFHRDHRQAECRSVRLERHLPARSSLLLVRPLLAPGPAPDEDLAAREFADRVSQAVARLDDDDREILLLRHVDELPYEEVGCLLGVEPAAARKRYGRALLRLRKVLADQGLLESPS